jgi:hypothetical protein
MQAELALFRSMNGALAFALNFRHGTLKPSQLSVMMGGSHPVGRGLSGLDGAAQAGMIRAEIDQLQPRVRGLILVAHFAPRSFPCPCRQACCSGHRPNGEWQQAISDIAVLVLSEALEGCSVNYGLRHAIIRRYFGVHKSLSEAAVQAGVHRDTASAHAAKIIPYLRGHDRAARFDLEARLKAAGVVE